MGGMIYVVYAAMYPEGVNRLMTGAASGAGSNAQADIEQLFSLDATGFHGWRLLQYRTGHH
jgi:pimeloyl-ACP methyl ester carboxylesterase